jgi:hypothetical protein
MTSQQQYQRNVASEGECRSERLCDALTDLTVYALSLDTECRRLDERLLELTKRRSSAAERLAVLHERAEAAEEATAFRHAMAAFRARFLSDETSGG